jgi:hypothetical protein
MNANRKTVAGKERSPFGSISLKRHKADPDLGPIYRKYERAVKRIRAQTGKRSEG